MFKKLIIVVVAGGLFVLGADKVFATSSGDNKPVKPEGYTKPVANNPGVNNCGLTNAKFAEFLGEKYGIKPVEGSANDKYQALANALSKKGINYFLNAKPTRMLTSSDVANVLYEATGAKGKLETCGLKVNYMVKNGLLKLPASGGDPCSGTALCNIADMFSGVEKYSPPPFGRPPTNPPERHDENPASHI